MIASLNADIMMTAWISQRLKIGRASIANHVIFTRLFLKKRVRRVRRDVGSKTTFQNIMCFGTNVPSY